MVDLKMIREHPDAVRQALRKRGGDPGLVDRVLDADRARRDLVQQVEALRAAQNKASQEIPRLSGNARAARIAHMKEVAAEAKAREPALLAAEAALADLLRQVPNLPHPDVPDGGPDDAVTRRVVGDPPRFDFPPRDHVDLGTALGLLDMDRAAKVSGSRFYFLRGDGALLQLALIRFAVDHLAGEGFLPIVPPVLVRREHLIGMMGGTALDAQMIYRIEGEVLALTGTSEMALGAMLAGEIVPEADLPLRLCGISTCFRREAGAHGRDTRGIFRVHQFDKVEMFVYTLPERSWDEHEYLLAVEERLWQGLGLPYRVVDIAAGDLGDPAARKYDIETWMPGRNAYAETQSCSNCTDFQSRALNIRVRRHDGGLEFVHTLNGTAIACTRAIVAILENFQEVDGSVRIPGPLRPYLGGRTHLRPTAVRVPG
jgi:seryl-tRNA synthetase